MRRAVLILSIAALCSPALAQRSRAQATAIPAPSSTPAPAPAASAPAPSVEAPGAAPGAASGAAPSAADLQRTTATFGDWVLRCLRPDKVAPSCEVTQTLVDKGQPVAQTAIGRAHAGEPIRLMVLVPVNVTLGAPPRLVGGESEGSVPPIMLTWRRCVPNGCIADTALNDEQLRRLRARAENGRVLFQDSTGREIPLPFGPRGLSQALDALAKEG